MTAHDEHTPARGSMFRDPLTARPTGTVAFLFTDVQGSTAAWEREPDAMNDVIARHDEAIRSAIEGHRGAVFSVAGDAFGAGFHTAADALGCAVAAQRALAAQQWPSGLTPLVRMGLHIGRAFERDGNYFGPATNRAARIMSAGHGGQILLSQEIVDALGPLGDGLAVTALGQFRLKDLTDAIAIHQLVIDGLMSDFPPLRATDAAARVPLPTSSFIGRECEMHELASLLSTSHLLTIVAGGGIGKTRLAIEAAAAATPRFADGVALVELADGSAADVVARLADAVLGDDPIALVEGGGDLLAAVGRHLRDARALIVVDNCEHVIDEVARVVASVIRACPEVVVLATSRERLGVQGERVVPLAPLATAPGDAGLSPAATLFVDRALSADPEIVLDQPTLDAIDAICHTVEGSALGIELAASRVRTLTPEQIAGRLDDSMELLRQRRSTAPDRHQSLESAIAWSYDLLDRDERRLLTWSSVFVGGFDLAGAESVGRAADVAHVVDVVESLVDKSMIGAQRVGAGMRYRLPEPIRQYAAARLVEAEQLDRALTAHFDHCRQHAKVLVALLDGHMDPPLFRSAAAELENFLAAIQRAGGRGDRRGAMALASSLDLYWAETGHVATAMQVLDALAMRQPDHPDTALVHVPLLWVATMAGELPRAIEVRELLEQQMADGTLPAPAMGGAAFGFGFVESGLGDGRRAAEAWRRAGQATAAFAPALARQAFWSAGQSATAAGDNDLALELYAEADRLDGPAPGWWPGFVETLRLVARTYQGERHVEELDAGVAALEDTGLKMRFVLLAAFVSLALFRSGEAADRAEHWWRRSMTVGREVGNIWGTWIMLECAAWSAVDRGDDELAAQLWHVVDTFAVQRGYGQWPIIATESARRRELVATRSPSARVDPAAQPAWSLAEAVEMVLTLPEADR